MNNITIGPAPSTPAHDVEPRCQCGRMLARYVTRPWVIVCPRCKAQNCQVLPGQAAEAFLAASTGTEHAKG